MITIKQFLQNIKLEENIKLHLDYIWEEIENYLNKLKIYSEESRKIFLQDYLIKEIANSSRIENTLYSFDAIHLYDEILSDNKLNKDILGQLNMMVRSKDKIIEREKYTNFFENLSYEEYLENEKWNLQGNYRKQVVWIGSSNDITKAIHVPPSPNKLEEYMEDFFDYYNNINYMLNEELNDPIIKAVLLHVIFIKIHPFANGNGRTARILLNNYLRDGINRKYNLNYTYPPLNLSMSFDVSKVTYNEKQNNIIFRTDVDNNKAINAWIKYNLIAIEEQLYYLNERLKRYKNFFETNIKTK